MALMSPDPEEVNLDPEAQPDAVLRTASAEQPTDDLYARTILSIEPSDLEAMLKQARDLLAAITEKGP